MKETWARVHLGCFAADTVAAGQTRRRREEQPNPDTTAELCRKGNPLRLLRPALAPNCFRMLGAHQEQRGANIVMIGTPPVAAIWPPAVPIRTSGSIHSTTRSCWPEPARVSIAR